MIAIIARSLWARKRRLVATLLAVALGVAFLAGTLLLSDTPARRAPRSPRPPQRPASRGCRTGRSTRPARPAT